MNPEWEWEQTPEITLKIVANVAEAVALFNRQSPRFAASLISSDPDAQESFYRSIDAPFVGDAHTRWVDGQCALNKPELGLSNWQGGRLFGRGGVLSGPPVRSDNQAATPRLQPGRGGHHGARIGRCGRSLGELVGVVAVAACGNQNPSIRSLV